MAGNLDQTRFCFKPTKKRATRGTGALRWMDSMWSMISGSWVPRRLKSSGTRRLFLGGPYATSLIIS